MENHRSSLMELAMKIRRMDAAGRAYQPQNRIERHLQIQELAYQKARQRGFSPGFEDRDWQAAELEFDR